MRIVSASSYGPPDVLTMRVEADPLPKPGQVLIDVAFAGVTFVETQVRSGRPPWRGPLPALPYFPGNAVEGVVASAGSAADVGLVGQRVVAGTGGSHGYADRALVARERLVEIPDGLAPGQAVALFADGRTAMALSGLGCLDSAKVVVITAAAGGVGSLIVQLAHAAGVDRVIALAGGQEKVRVTHSLGADSAIDYRVDGWVELLRAHTNGSGQVVIFDGVGGSVGRALFEAAPARTRICVFGMSSGSYTDASVSDVVARGVTIMGGVQVVSAAESQALGAVALKKAALGLLRPVIGRIYPLEQAAEAHADMESRSVVGKTLLSC
jgi:NADPH:quinone reductase